MLWRRSPQPLSIPPSAPVPDAEALRRAALQASWRRDRWVARRRVLLRWLLWATGRYLMPAMLVFGLGAWLWLGVLPNMGNPLDRLAIFQQPAANPAAATPPPPVAVATSSVQALAPAEPATAEDDGPAYSPEGEELPVPLRLRFEPRWAVSASSGSITATVSAAADTLTTIQPHLKPENWLHSKEP
jgi:hypothetical protein